jgi:hypothetical protein
MQQLPWVAPDDLWVEIWKRAKKSKQKDLELTRIYPTVR